MTALLEARGNWFTHLPQAQGHPFVPYTACEFWMDMEIMKMGNHGNSIAKCSVLARSLTRKGRPSPQGSIAVNHRSHFQIPLGASCTYRSTYLSPTPEHLWHATPSCPKAVIPLLASSSASILFTAAIKRICQNAILMIPNPQFALADSGPSGHCRLDVLWFFSLKAPGAYRQSSGSSNLCCLFLSIRFLIYYFST